MDNRALQIQACMYQYSRAIYRSIKDLIDPYVDDETRSTELTALAGQGRRLYCNDGRFQLWGPARSA